MKLVWHIVGKDLRRHWLGFAVWLLLLLARPMLALTAFSSAAADPEWFHHRTMLCALLGFSEGLLAFCIVAYLVVDDGTGGSNLFWATRPISGARLLVAKLLAVLLVFVMAPLLLSFPWWLASGLGGEPLMDAAWTTVAVQLAVIAPAFALATLCGTGGRMLRVVLALVAVAILAQLYRSGVADVSLPPPFALRDTRWYLALMLVALTSAVVVWRQFTTRRTKQTVALACVGFAMVLAAATAWPWALPHAPLPDLPGTESVTLELESARRGSSRDNSPIPPSYDRVELTFRARKLPLEFRLASGSAKVRLQWADGTSFEQDVWLIEDRPVWFAQGTRLPVRVANFDAETVAYEERTARGNPALLEPWSVLHATLRLPVELVARMEKDAPACRIDAKLQFQRPTIHFQIPLREGERGVGGGVRAYVAKVEEFKEVSPLRDGCAVIVSLSPNENIHPEFYAVSEATGRVGGFKPRVPEVTLAFSPLARSVTEFRAVRLRRGDDWVEAPPERSCFRLIAVSYSHVGGATRHIDLPQIPWVRRN